MNITLHGQPIKRAGELEIGESGFVLCVTHGVAMPDETSRIFPVMLPPMGDCYRVTRNEDGLDVVFVSAVSALLVIEEKLIVAEGIDFGQDVADAQALGWRVDANSMQVSIDICTVLLHRPMGHE